MKVFEHEDFEVILRRIMCLLFCFEAISLFASRADNIDDVVYYTHSRGFTYMLLSHSLKIALLPIAYALIPMFVRPIYRFIEIIHILAGILILVYDGMMSASALPHGILRFLLISGRGLLYFVLIVIYDKRQRKTAG